MGVDITKKRAGLAEANWVRTSMSRGGFVKNIVDQYMLLTYNSGIKA